LKLFDILILHSYLFEEIYPNSI